MGWFCFKTFLFLNLLNDAPKLLSWGLSNNLFLISDINRMGKRAQLEITRLNLDMSAGG